MRPITVASLFKYNQHDKGGDRTRQGFQHPLLKNMPLLLFCLIQKLTTHSSSLIVAPVAVSRPSDCIMGILFDSTGSRTRDYSPFRRHTFRTRDNHENASGRQDFPHKHEKRKRRDVCVQRPRYSLTQIAPIPKV